MRRAEIEKLHRISFGMLCFIAFLGACTTEENPSTTASAQPASIVANPSKPEAQGAPTQLIPGPDVGKTATITSQNLPPVSLNPQTNRSETLTRTPEILAPLPGPQTEIFAGSGQFFGRVDRGTAYKGNTSDENGITLNFVGADVKDVAKTILGDYLKLNYEIGANVDAVVTIQTSEPLDRSQVLPVLERVLRIQGLALVETNGVYRVIPVADAHRATDITPIQRPSSRAPGYGIEVIPLHYIGAAEMRRLLEPLAPAQSIVHVDEGRNLLIIEGTSEERRTLVESISLFDADWLSGMSFAFYTPTYMDAQNLTKELNQILNGFAAGGTGTDKAPASGNPIGNLVRLVTIDRLNTVLAISPQISYLKQLESWVKRLDRPGQGGDRQLYVYYVQNGRAADLAGTLVKVMGKGGGSSVSSIAKPEGTTASTEVALAPLSAGGITADETNNALVILATPQEYSGIQMALRQLDRAPVQVFLEAAIAEITLNDNLKYGVQYFFSPNAANQITLSASPSSAITSTFPGFSYLFSPGTNIRLILDALDEVTDVNVVSSPKIMVLNNQTANLQVGDQVPIITEQAVSTVVVGAPVVNSVQYQDTGIILQVTPRVNRSGVVMMDISQEVSSVIATTTSSIDSPTIQKRKINSSVAVQDGETVALGGLITNSDTRGRSGIPGLQSIPILGNLFRSTERKKGRTELMVLLTPHVIDDVQKARAVTDELRRKLPSVQALLEKVH